MEGLFVVFCQVGSIGRLQRYGFVETFRRAKVAWDLIPSRRSSSANAIVLSDFRLTPLLAAVDLYHRWPRSEFFLSAHSLLEGDYGDDVDQATRVRILRLLRRHFQITVCHSTARDKTNLNNGASMSSLVSITNDSRATPIRYPELWEKCVRLEEGSQSVRRRILQRNCENVFVFNGRTASTRALAKLTDSERPLRTWFYEFGMWPGFYRAQRTPLHDRAARGEQMVAWAESIGFQHSKTMARRAMVAKLGNSFESGLSKAPTLTSYETVIFSGSPHEYLWWGDSQQVGFDSDLVGFVRQAQELNFGSARLAIRLHPNMVNDPSSSKILDELRLAFHPGELEVIPPDSNWSSHRLIEQASTVIVAGSSIALDALYLGKSPITLESNEISKMMAASSARFRNLVAVRENIAGVFREYGMRESRTPSLRTLSFLALYSLYMGPPAGPVVEGFFRGVIWKGGLAILSLWRAFRKFLALLTRVKQSSLDIDEGRQIRTSQ